MTNNSGKIQAIRGMNDVLPDQTIYWQHIEKICQQVAGQYGYREIRFPILEQTELFKRSIGDATDIVEKEMYTFLDRNNDSLTLRPEGTAGCVRAGIEHGILYNQIQRLWYLGYMFRHERPQKGRYRQFQQFGIEVFGLADAKIDAEVILLSYRLWKQLNIADHIQLEINTLGSIEQRKKYRDALVEYFTLHHEKLDEDSKRRLHINPLRILDSKNFNMRELIEKAPRLIEFVDGEPKKHFDSLCFLLKEMDISFRINPYLVRGLDYYCLTVFEWVTEQLGAQGTVCAGGRYNGLVEQLGGKTTPAVGFAMGFERIALLLQTHQPMRFLLHFYVIVFGNESVYSYALSLVEKIRDRFSYLHIEMNTDNTGFKTQIKRADKSGAQFALIIGDSELKNHSITLKYLRENVEQQTISFQQLLSLISECSI